MKLTPGLQTFSLLLQKMMNQSFCLFVVLLVLALATFAECNPQFFGGGFGREGGFGRGFGGFGGGRGFGGGFGREGGFGRGFGGFGLFGR